MRILRRSRPILLSLAIVAGILSQTATAKAATDHIVVAGGCFWCVESDFESVPGVNEVISGYTGGNTADPSYKQVTGGGTGHFEAVRIEFNDRRTNVAELYHMFFRSIDPTDAGGQFCDRGASYRTAIFVSDPVQKAAAQTAKAQAEAELGRSIVTPILNAGAFYEAEDVHQDYYKGTNRVLTRFGPIKQSEAYKRYRKACGRDARVQELWGSAAPFVGH